MRENLNVENSEHAWTADYVVAKDNLAETGDRIHQGRLA